MPLRIDATFVDVWTEFICLREQGVIEDLDEKSQSIIYVVAAAEARHEHITKRGVLKALKPRSIQPMTVRMAELLRDGWLSAEEDANDRRVKNLRLTQKSIMMINILSHTLKKVVKTATVLAAAMMALLLDFETSVFRPYAMELLTI